MSLVPMSCRLAFALAVTGLLGCGHESPPPKTAKAVPHATAKPPVTTSAEVPAAPKVSSSLSVSDEIVRACNIEFGSVERAPKFDFDRSDLLLDDREVLGQIAKCLTNGPLKGRRIQLVGRADPRGEEEYNMSLGERRAASVKEYLTGLGVANDNVALTSRGELDATGTDELGWQRDRRVDVNLE